MKTLTKKNFEKYSLFEDSGEVTYSDCTDIVSSPEHYIAGRRYEPRKVIEDWNLNFYLGNALKYISRAGRKEDAITDLRKAKQYIDFEIERLTNLPDK